MRFANRVPLQYQPKACAISEAVYELNWKNYGLSQPRGSLPVAPMAIFIHLASVWVPFTSEAKEAVAHYPELLREITLSLQECGRKLAQSLRARARAEGDLRRRSLFERYIPELGQSLSKITGQAKDAIEKAFLDALPNFVKISELVGPPPEGGGGGDGGDGGALPPEATPEPEPKPKPKSKRKSEPEPEAAKGGGLHSSKIAKAAGRKGAVSESPSGKDAVAKPGRGPRVSNPPPLPEQAAQRPDSNPPFAEQLSFGQ